MTDDQWIELARRAVACKGWRWMPGMLDMDGGRVLQPLGLVTAQRLQLAWAILSGPFAVPDLRDPATLGCLLELVREAWGPVIVRPPEDAPAVVGWWEVERLSDGKAWGGATEADALVAALEATP